MIVFTKDSAPQIDAVTNATVMLLGQPLGTRDHLVLEVGVPSRLQRIEEAKADWRAGRIPLPVGDADEFIPLPEEPPPPPKPMSLTFSTRRFLTPEDGLLLRAASPSSSARRRRHIVAAAPDELSLRLPKKRAVAPYAISRRRYIARILLEQHQRATVTALTTIAMTTIELAAALMHAHEPLRDLVGHERGERRPARRDTPAMISG